MAKATVSELSQLQKELSMLTHTSINNTVPPSSKPNNPFSIESILKSEPTSSIPPSTNEEESSATNPILLQQLNAQTAFLLYQTQLQWRLLFNRYLMQNQITTLINTVYPMSSLHGNGNNIKNKMEVKPVQSPAPQKRMISTPNTTVIIPKPKGKMNQLKHPSAEKKIKLQLEDEDSVSSMETRLLTETECNPEFQALNTRIFSAYDLSSNKVSDVSDVIKQLAPTSNDPYLHELRKIAMIKRSPEGCRIRRKNEEQMLDGAVSSLNQQKNRLVSERESLTNEISRFQSTVGILL